jgi:hypothetical protein
MISKYLPTKYLLQRGENEQLCNEGVVLIKWPKLTPVAMGQIKMRFYLTGWNERNREPLL